MRISTVLMAIVLSFVAVSSASAQVPFKGRLNMDCDKSRFMANVLTEQYGESPARSHSGMVESIQGDILRGIVTTWENRQTGSFSITFEYEGMMCLVMFGNYGDPA